MESLTFLVVDDSPTMRQLIAFSLQRFRGCKIIEAVDGVDALKKLQDSRIDMLLVDINMPVMDGLKLISIVRQDPKMKNLPVIIITTEGAEEDRKRGLALGADAYLPKPIQTSLLLRVIQQVFDSYK